MSESSYTKQDRIAFLRENIELLQILAKRYFEDYWQKLNNSDTIDEYSKLRSVEHFVYAFEYIEELFKLCDIATCSPSIDTEYIRICLDKGHFNTPL